MKSLTTGLKVLAQFSVNGPSLGVMDIAQRCGLTKSQVSRILASFRDQGLLVQDETTKRYSVSLLLFSIGSKFLLDHSLARQALPVMRALVADSGHSARLSVVDEERIVYLAAIEGPLFLETGWRAGTILPWHASSAGRLLLSFYSEEKQDRIFDKAGLAAITPYTVTDRKKLKAIMHTLRQQGWSVAHNETTVGLGAMSAPIFGRDQDLLGALTLAYPDDAVSAGEETRLIRMLQNAARSISLRSGSQVYPFTVPEDKPAARSQRAAHATRPAARELPRRA